MKSSLLVASAAMTFITYSLSIGSPSIDKHYPSPAHMLPQTETARKPKTIVSHVGVPFALVCPRGKVGTWFRRRSDDKYDRLIGPSRRRLVVVPRRDAYVGFYKCGAKEEWDYRVVAARSRSRRGLRRRSVYGTSKRCEENLKHKYYHFEVIATPVDENVKFECDTRRNRAFDLSAKFSYRWFKFVLGERTNKTKLRVNGSVLVVRVEKGYFYECRYKDKATNDSFTDRFYIADPNVVPGEVTTLDVQCRDIQHKRHRLFYSDGGNDINNISSYIDITRGGKNEWSCPSKITKPCLIANDNIGKYFLKTPILDRNDQPPVFAFICGRSEMDEKLRDDCWTWLLTVKYTRGKNYLTKSVFTEQPTTSASSYTANPVTTTQNRLLTPTTSSIPTTLAISTTKPPTPYLAVQSSPDLPTLIGSLTAVVVVIVVIVVVLFFVRRRRLAVWLKRRKPIDGSGNGSDDLIANDMYGKLASVPMKRKNKRTIVIRGIALDEPYEIPKDRVTLLNTLGEGCFGFVMKGIATNVNGITGSTQVAVKVAKAKDEKSTQELASEVKVWMRIGRHKNVIGLIGITLFQTNFGPVLWVIMEYATNGCLHKYMRAKRFGRQPHDDDLENDALSYVPPDDQTVLSSSDMFRYALDIAQGMEHLTRKECLHRDLAARNVLVCDGDVLKVSDFGMAKDIHYFEYYRKKTPKNLVPYRWTAPEALMHRKFTEATDVWSFGIVLWEIATLGSAPYPGVPTERLYDLLTKDGYRMRKPRTCSRTFYDLMLKCWAQNPAERPKFSQLVGLIKTGLAQSEHKAVSSRSDSVIEETERGLPAKRQLSSQDSGIPRTPLLSTSYNPPPVFSSVEQSIE